MTITMYQASVPVLTRALANLDAYLKKGEDYATERGFDPAVLLSARLAPDMFPLTRQVQIACDHAKNAPSRLAGRDLVPMADTETTFAELHERIAKVQAHIATFTPADIDGSEDRDIVVKMRSGELKLTGLPYLQAFAMPNFWFHVTIAYAILRHNGVPVGKMDFTGRP